MLGNVHVLVKDVLVYKPQVLKDLIEELNALDIPAYRGRLALVIINERGEIKEGRGLGVVREVITMFWHQFSFTVAKGSLGEVKLERVEMWSSPIAVCDMRGGSLGSCRVSLGVCS